MEYYIVSVKCEFALKKCNMKLVKATVLSLLTSLLMRVVLMKDGGASRIN